MTFSQKRDELGMARRRIGYDLDGCLCDFNSAYVKKAIEITGRNLFPPEWLTAIPTPPVWDYMPFYGYTPEETSRTWNAIQTSQRFWRDLTSLPGAESVYDNGKHDVYFVTNRKGIKAKMQTEVWLTIHEMATVPTVLLTEDKGLVARALKLDVYLDDKLENIFDVHRVSPNTHAYLLDASYNRNGRLGLQYPVVKSIREMMELEGLI